jgi:hypothetical protein
MRVLPQALEIILEVQMKRSSNKKEKKEKKAFQSIKHVFFLFFPLCTPLTFKASNFVIF